MSIRTTKFIAGALALAVAGSAFADTTIDATSTGDLFLNIVNTTNNTSYIFDTGVSTASFNGNGSYSFTLSTDANLTAFLAESGGSFYYSVVAGSNTGGNHVDITGSQAPTLVSATRTGTARSAIGGFLSTADSTSSTSTTSAILGTPALSWNNSLAEGVASKNVFNVSTPPYADEAAFDTALAFYSVGTTATTFASTWNFASATDILTYGPQGAPVPLPAPILLLASALGFMGVVSRRKKAA